MVQVRYHYAPLPSPLIDEYGAPTETVVLRIVLHREAAIAAHFHRVGDDGAQDTGFAVARVAEDRDVGAGRVDDAYGRDTSAGIPRQGYIGLKGRRAAV